jgi:tetratricopeptide (TPR) repeat protein
MRCVGLRHVGVVLFAVAAAAAPLPAQFRLPVKLEELERRAKADSNDPAAHFNVALAYWNAKRWVDVERSLRLAITIDPRFAPGYMALHYLPYAQRSRLWDEVGERRVPEEWKARIQESESFFRRAYVIDPLVELRSGDVVQPRSTAYLQELELVFGEHVRDYYDGLDQYFLGEYQKAYDRFARVVNSIDGDRHPDRIPSNVLWWHGLASARVEKWPEAISDFAMLMDRSLEPTRRDSLVHFPLRTNEFRYVQAYLKQRSGKVNEAIDLYREAITNDIGLYMAHVRLAEMYEAAQMLDQALLSRRNAVNANPDDPSLLVDLGKTLAAIGRFGDAVEPLRQATDMNPRDARAYFYLGLVLEQLGNKNDARVALTSFTSLAPSRYERQIAIARQHLAALH